MYFFLGLISLFLVCYTVESFKDKRIIGGIDASIGNWPGLVSIRNRNLQKTLNWMQVPYQSKSGHFCAGTLITPQWIITAASCFPDREVETLLNERNFNIFKIRKLRWLMRTSTSRLNLKDYRICFDTQCNLSRNVKNIVLHPGFIVMAGIQDPGYDIAMIQLDQPINNIIPTTIGHIPAKMNHDSSNLNCKIAGWGLTNDNQMVNEDRLKELPIKLMEFNKCMPQIRKLELCGKSYNGYGDFCFFDAGGPLFCKTEGGSNDWQLFGLISRGTEYQCSSIQNKGIYTNVTGYISWIMSVIEKSGTL